MSWLGLGVLVERYLGEIYGQNLRGFRQLDSCLTFALPQHLLTGILYTGFLKFSVPAKVKP